jgi:hypothetical protein
MLIVLLAILWMPLAAAETPKSLAFERIDRVVAMVDSAVVTESDLRVHTALSKADPSPLSILSPNLKGPLADVIDATVIRLLAGRISTYQPNPAQLRARVEAYRSQWADINAWDSHLAVLGLDERRLQRAIHRRMVIERVIQRSLNRPKTGEEQAWKASFDAWIARERNRVHLRMVLPSETNP